MNIPNVSQNRNLFYVLLVLALLGVGAIVFLNYYSFADNSQTSGETIDVAKVEIKNLNTKVLTDNQFKSLQKMEAAPDNTGSLEKGKRNPFLPN
jgi:hypothetical protein